MRLSLTAVLPAALCASILLAAGAKAQILDPASLLDSSGSAQTYSYTGSIQMYTVLTTGTYAITAAGAQGGAGYEGSGGMGAVISGDTFLNAGTVLDIVVGGAGVSGVPTFNAGGGGGGSFLYVSGASQPLMAAGGGGGGGYDSSGNGGAAQSGVNGGDASGVHGGAGGTSGAGGGGGTASEFNGGGGGGWLGNGGASSEGDYNGMGGFGPSSFAGGGGSTAGGMPYPVGGFGGGGGGGSVGGGGGGDGRLGDGASGGGGGGSYLDTSDYSITNITEAVTQSGDGSVSITLESAAPEPSTWAMACAGLASLVFWKRRKQKAA